jgi:hypothetical protein
MKRRVTPRVRVAATLVLGATLAAGAMAQQSSPTPPPATPPAAPAPARAATAPVEIPAHIQDMRKALSGMLVAIDPATGTLRAPDAEEVDALTGMAAAARFAEPAPIDLPGGGSAVRTSPMSVDLLTVKRRADGSMAFTCAHGIEAASKTFAEDHRRIEQEARDDR